MAHHCAMERSARDGCNDGSRRNLRRSAGTALLILAATLTVSARFERGVPPVFRCGAPVGTIYRVSRSTGELELDRLAGSALIEDAWVFLEPGSLWIDVGPTEMDCLL